MKSLACSLLALLWWMAVASASQAPTGPFGVNLSGNGAGWNCVSGTQVVGCPVAVTNAAGVTTTTTGAIQSGQNTLTLASVSGWAVGMGVAVAGAGTGGSGGTELVSRITAINGLVLTLVDNASSTVSGAVVNHDDTAAIAAAIATGLPVWLRSGNYNVSSGFTISSPTSFIGDGRIQSMLWSRLKTGDLFTVNYQQGTPFSVVTTSAMFANFGISQASGVTPTAGAGFNIASASGAGFYVIGLTIENVVMNSLYTGISVGAGVAQNWFTNIQIENCGTYGILYSSPAPSGDNHWNDIEMNGTGCQLRITASDTQEFTNLKTNGSGISFGGGAPGNILRVRFVNPSIEGNGTVPSCGIDFGSQGATQITIVGGEIAGAPTPICNAANVVGGLSILGVLQTDNLFNAVGAFNYLPAVNFNGVLTVGTLPTCNAGALGQLRWVSDANSPTYNGTLSGGGTGAAAYSLAFCNGTNWTAH